MCVDRNSCPKNFIPNNNNKLCVANCDMNKFYDPINNQCGDGCPDQYYKDISIFKCIEL